jgi:hypothetical protein
MKPSGRILALGLVAAVVLPGLVFGLSVCAMADCPALAAAGHDCCPPDGAEIAAACCRQSFETSTPPSHPPERFGAMDASVVLGQVAGALVPVPASELRVLVARPPHPLDCLGQTCLLRI